jgi:hypothetical protein
MRCSRLFIQGFVVLCSVTSKEDFRTIQQLAHLLEKFREDVGKLILKKSFPLHSVP